MFELFNYLFDLPIDINDAEYTVTKNDDGDFIFKKKKSIKDEKVYKDFQEKIKDIDEDIFQKACLVLRLKNKSAFDILNSTSYADTNEFANAAIDFNDVLKEVVRDKIVSKESEIKDIEQEIIDLKEKYQL